MSNTFRKLVKSTMALALTMMGSVYGDCCPQPSYSFADSCCPTYSTEASGEWIFGAGVICWRAFEGDFDCGCGSLDILDEQTSDGDTISLISGNDDELHYDWNAGFRVGAGYRFACSKWDVGAVWTNYSGHGHGSSDEDNHIHWNLNFNEVDVVTGYGFETLTCFTVRPFVGVRGTWMDQKVRAHLTTFVAAESREAVLHDNNKHTQNFWGVGPVFGVEANWALGCGFGFYGIIDGAVLYGRSKTHFDDIEVAVDDTTVTTFTDIKNRHTVCQLAGDVSLGFYWEKTLCNDMLLTLQLGWEHHHYFDFNRLGETDDLSFDGLSFSGAIGF